MKKCLQLVLLLTLGLGGSFSSVFGQMEMQWRDFSEVNFDFKYIPAEKKLASNPNFPPEIQALSGQRIRIAGYVIPMKADENAYALSEFPNASCFFCGNAGLETIMELRLKKKRTRYKTDDFRTFSGVLRLSSDINELPLVLEDAIAE